MSLHITVCICTRNRGDRIRPTLESVCASSYTDIDIVIVDQSDSDETERAVQAAIGSSPYLGAYIHSPTIGLSVARNIAVAHACGPIIAFTDDDCVVSPDWLKLLARHFIGDPRVGAIYGGIHAAPHDPTLVYSPAFIPPDYKRFTTPWRRWGELGAGANMAFRRVALEAAGPFDEVLGAGAPLPSAEDIDMTHRILRAGYHALNVADACVTHHGFYAHNAIREYVLVSEFAAGAAYMKHLRLGDVTALPVLLRRALGCVTWRRLLLLRRESGATRSLQCLRGMCASFHYRIDRRKGVYQLTPR